MGSEFFFECRLEGGGERGEGCHPSDLLCLLTFIRAGIFNQYMGARNRVGIGLSHRHARLHRLAPGGIHSLESIPGLHKRLKIPALVRAPH
jgi:hypothetical protein